MKILVQICIILLLFGCSNTSSITSYPPPVNLVMQQDKYSLILKHHFYKNFNTSEANINKILVKADLTFNSSNALSDNGSKNLTIVKGTINFKVFDNSNTSSINTGSVSSLYGIDKNNEFAKERISRYLSSKLYRKILLINSHSEN